MFSLKSNIDLSSSIEKVDKEFADAQQKFLYLFLNFENLFKKFDEFKTTSLTNFKELEKYYNEIINQKSELRGEYENLIKISLEVNTLLDELKKIKIKEQSNASENFTKLSTISQKLQQFLEISKQKCDFSRKATRTVSEFYEKWQVKFNIN